VVFDRGGWSPKLFKKLVARGYDVLTYRKGKHDPVPADWFEPHPGRSGEPPWLLHDASVLIQDGLWMRQITRLVGEHQTTIVTTRQDLGAALLACRMFNRWRQENFFKCTRSAGVRPWPGAGVGERAPRGEPGHSRVSSGGGGIPAQWAAMAAVRKSSTSRPCL
jgi:hypothetical protein